jgi:beta-glucosidase-like glycosyl hydrolase
MLARKHRRCVGARADRSGRRARGAPQAAALEGASAGCRIRRASHDAPETAHEAVYLNARLIAHDLCELGINVDCTPVLDVPVEGAHDVIGDRAFAHDATTIIDLGRAVIEGMIEGGVLPVMKHIPGHGRATADSHMALPRVTTPETNCAPAISCRSAA